MAEDIIARFKRARQAAHERAQSTATLVLRCSFHQAQLLPVAQNDGVIRARCPEDGCGTSVDITEEAE